MPSIFSGCTRSRGARVNLPSPPDGSGATHTWCRSKSTGTLITMSRKVHSPPMLIRKARHLPRSLWSPVSLLYLPTCRLANLRHTAASFVLQTATNPNPGPPLPSVDRAAAVREGGERARERGGYLGGLHSLRAMVPLEGRPDAWGKNLHTEYIRRRLTGSREIDRTHPLCPWNTRLCSLPDCSLLW